MGDDATVHGVTECIVTAVALRLEDREIVCESSTAPAVFLGNRAAQQAELAGFEPHGPVDTMLGVPLLTLGDQFTVEETTGQFGHCRDLVVVPRRLALGRHDQTRFSRAASA